MESQQRIEQIVVIALLVVLAAGCLTVLRPFLSALLWALILSFSSWPLHAGLVRRLRGRRTLAAFLMTVLVAAVFILPLAAAGTGLADSVAKVGGMVAALLREGPPGPPAWVAELPIVGTQLTERWLELERLGAGWTAELQPYLDTALNWLLSLGVRLGEAILQVSLGVLAAFFFFRDGAEGARRLDAAVQRLAGNRAQQLLAVAGGTVRSVVYGVIGTALAQASLQALGLWLAGVPAAFFLGFLTFFLSFVPVGPPLVWLSAAVWLLYNGAIGWGLFLIGWGFFVVSGVDNVLRPYLISRGSNLPLILMFFGVLGGLMAFGFLGVFLGPTLLALGYVLVQEWSGAPQRADGELGAEAATAPLGGPRAAEGSSAPAERSRIEPAA
ncbi:MAG: AI-2E family transporter [Geminicoccaceae bacterium]